MENKIKKYTCLTSSLKILLQVGYTNMCKGHTMA